MPGYHYFCIALRRDPPSAPFRKDPPGNGFLCGRCVATVTTVTGSPLIVLHTRVRVGANRKSRHACHACHTNSAYSSTSVVFSLTLQNSRTLFRLR
ncbi:hypothetical protein SAMN05444169_5907 [Bradyrhizobium erythrophlei]|uniref:Uncharacterized protein n=1 Tax=Bradyrhizobium erythrophlei TaxID=1437360 RepID=A0A1M5QFR4_9BRAD|nr:hypothetical protein SAMN05444169_5907 [Bradyrhizobium erythrophlei]